jgi:hypothetical protein
LVVGNKAFGFTPAQIIELPYFTFMSMLMDYNVMSERPDKTEKVIKGSGMGLAQFM